MGLIKHIKASNILSFGPNGLDLPLSNLNVFIGPNGSGKSNFIELLAFLRATPADLNNVILSGGGIWEWIWKGSSHPEASIEVLINTPSNQEMPLRHEMYFKKENDRFYLMDERIRDERSRDAKYPLSIIEYYHYQHGQPVIKANNVIRRPKPGSIASDASILAQRNDPDLYPELSYLGDIYKKIFLYQEWYFGRDAEHRKPQPSGQRNDRLEKDFSNLGLILNRLRRDPKTKRALTEHLRDLYDGLTDFEVNIVEGGYVQILFEEGDFTIPSTRLSDGSLRYLCLLAILLDPTPPPVICIDEPELGLHPDILSKIADLLIAASERTQLFVTTHSRILIDALSEQPDSVIVCSKTEGQSKFERLDAESLKLWLEKYTLGDLWSMGEIGGNRW